MGPGAFRALPKGGFVFARLVPIRPVPGAWLVSGTMSSYRKSDAGGIAKVALELATKRRELVTVVGARLLELAFGGRR
jgi:hypothetical protein